MLGKLMKYEWKATWKLLLPMNLFIVVMSFFAYATVQMSFFDSDSVVVMLMGGFVIMAYILSLVVVSIVTMIFLVYRAYKSIYGDEGYLLHTLPVDKHHIIISKTVVSLAWVVINILLIYLSFVFMISTQMEFIKNVFEGFNSYIELINGYEEIGAFDVIMTLIAGFIALIAKVLKFGACISLGQLSSNHKVLASFGFYYGIYFVQNIFNMMYLVIVEMMVDTTVTTATMSASAGIGATWAFDLIANLIYCVVFYIATWYVMEKKLNLE